MTRYLVTGGAGFIGSHLVEHLLKTTDASVVILDRLDETSTLHRVGETDAYKQNRHRVTVVWHDLKAPLSAYIADKIGEPSIVFHLAASTHVDRSIVNPMSFVADNVLGTVNLMQWARGNKSLERFVYFSTDEVFGPAALKVPEPNARRQGCDEWIYGPWDRYKSSNPYAASKAAAEEFVVAYQNTYGLPTIITHCVNAFGERQHPEKYLPLVIGKILNGELIWIHSDKEGQVAAHRQYIHARNVAAALLWLTTTSNRPPSGSKVNIGGQVELGADELAQRVAEILEKPAKMQKIAFHASRPGHDMRYALLDGLVSDGFTYPVGFDESLERTVLWYRANRAWLLGGSPA